MVLVGGEDGELRGVAELLLRVLIRLRLQLPCRAHGGVPFFEKVEEMVVEFGDKSVDVGAREAAAHRVRCEVVGCECGAARQATAGFPCSASCRTWLTAVTIDCQAATRPWSRLRPLAVMR